MYNNRVADLKVNNNAGFLKSETGHLLFRQRNRFGARTNKPGHSAGVAYYVPGIIIHNHVDQYVSGKHLLGNLFIGSILDFDNFLHRHGNL